MLVAALVSILISRGRSAGADAANTAAAVTSTPAPTMGDKATRVEEKILRGESLLESDTDNLSAYELRVLRNVHFARYGRQYDRPGLGDYFSTRPWYKPGGGYNESMLTATDKGNINLILAIEGKLGGAPATGATTTASANVMDVQPAPSPPPAATSNGYGLSEEDLRQMILRRGVWSLVVGWVPVTDAEILRVGNVNEQQNYLPVRARVSMRTRGPYVVDYQIFKNDYGDWAVRMVGSI